MRVSLIVIRAADIEATRRFYELIGAHFTPEQHGRGPLHYAAELGEVVFEIYPLGDRPPTTSVRLGFRVPSVVAVVTALRDIGVECRLSAEADHAVVTDPDGHRVELTQ